MTAREFLGDETFKAWMQDYESIRRYFKSGAQPRELMPAMRAFEAFYKRVLG